MHRRFEHACAVPLVDCLAGGAEFDGSNASEDRAPGDPSVRPGVGEIPGDGVDNDYSGGDLPCGADDDGSLIAVGGVNSDCERSLRHIAVGRASWLFCGSDDGAEATAVWSPASSP